MPFKIPKIIIVIVAVLTIYVFFLGLSHFGMGMDMNSEIVNCPFSGHSMSICKMNPLEHIQEWQSMFTTLPTKDALMSLVVFLMFVVLSRLKFRNRFSIPEIKYLYTKYLFQNNFHISNPLKEAFSRGIINPKIF